MEYYAIRSKNLDKYLIQLIFSLKLIHNTVIPNLCRFIANFQQIQNDLSNKINKKLEAQFYKMFRSKNSVILTNNDFLNILLKYIVILSYLI